MSKHYAVFRHWYDEGNIVPDSREQFGLACEDKTHVERAASYHTRAAGVADMPYVFFCEEIPAEPEHRPADVCLITGQPLFCPTCGHELSQWRGYCFNEDCPDYDQKPYLGYNERHEAWQAAERSDRFLRCGV